MTGKTDFDQSAAILRKQYPNVRLLNVTGEPEGSYSYYQDLRVFRPALKLGGVTLLVLKQTLAVKKDTKE